MRDGRIILLVKLYRDAIIAADLAVFYYVAIFADT